MKKSRVRPRVGRKIKKKITKKKIPKKKVDFYSKAIHDILKNILKPKQLDIALNATLADGKKLFDSENKDLDYELINLLKKDSNNTLKLISKSKQYKNANEMYFNLNVFSKARLKTIQHENDYFHIAEFIESGIRCENPECLSYNVRVKDIGTTRGDEPSLTIYKCLNCEWNRVVK